jgi:DNA-binding response OmpR family regulator
MQSDTTKTSTEQESPLIDKNMKDGVIVQTVGGIIAGIGLLVIVFFWNKIITFIKSMGKTKYSSLNEVTIKYNFEELKSTLKIIVIDDDDIFPVSGFHEFGYSIESWKKLDHAKLKQLYQGDFDVIILDIYGIAKDLAAKDGFDVLVEIKSKNPAQVVVAYSGQSFDFSKNKFWELADDKLGKPTPFIGTQSLIDNLIERTFSLEYHKQKIESVLKENKIESQLSHVEHVFVKAKIDNAEPNWFEKVSFLNLKREETSKVAAILSKLYKITELKR